MEEITVENNLDKECSALGGLFQHIVDETKVSNFSLAIEPEKEDYNGLLILFFFFFFN